MHISEGLLSNIMKLEKNQNRRASVCKGHILRHSLPGKCAPFREHGRDGFIVFLDLGRVRFAHFALRYCPSGNVSVAEKAKIRDFVKHVCHGG